MLVSRTIFALLLFFLVLHVALEVDGARRRRRMKRQHQQHPEEERRRWRRREERRERWRGRGGGAVTNGSHVGEATPIRHHDPESAGIRVGIPQDAPQCPPPATPFVPELCSAPACLQHQQCQGGATDEGGEGPEHACCFNGCVHTCLPSVGSPPVIDWLEDTGSLLPILEERAPPDLPIRYEEEIATWAEGGTEEVHLPGGCTISGTQYTQLQDFMKTPSIETCMCNKGEVVCAVKLFKT